MWHAANRSIQSHTMREGRVAALFGIAFVFLASSCGQSTPLATLPTSSAQLPTPSVVPTGFGGIEPGTTASPPPGGPLPAQLLGNWYLPGAALMNAVGEPCPANPAATNCFFQLTFEATNFQQFFLYAGGYSGTSQGDVVVKNNEIDFFNEGTCALKLPDGVGRYTWRVTAGVLYFTLISDPCGRRDVYTNRGWRRTL
jgi:hypothetical protein